jgi:hypothetical protein
MTDTWATVLRVTVKARLADDQFLAVLFLPPDFSLKAHLWEKVFSNFDSLSNINVIVHAKGHDSTVTISTPTAIHIMVTWNA